jgi:hypothetical protein
MGSFVAVTFPLHHQSFYWKVPFLSSSQLEYALHEGYLDRGFKVYNPRQEKGRKEVLLWLQGRFAEEPYSKKGYLNICGGLTLSSFLFRNI